MFCRQIKVLHYVVLHMSFLWDLCSRYVDIKQQLLFIRIFIHKRRHEKENFISIFVLAVALSMTAILAGCGSDEKDEAESKGTIILATTTSTKDSGLLDEILPVFEEESGYSVDVVSVGSGEAMTMGENGEADVLLVHSPAAEKEYVEGGHADEDGRMDVMYNDFVVVGPEADPAAIGENAKDDAVAAFTAIMEQQQTFVSRADESGTHKRIIHLGKSRSDTVRRLVCGGCGRNGRCHHYDR